jgi:RecB family exonuclease
MTAKVYIYEPSTCLISALVETAAGLSPSELQETLILLPTQRLATYVLAGLLRHHGALRPPRLLTLENLLSQVAPRDRRLIGDSGVDLLLGRLIAEGQYTHLRPGHERELRLLYGEIFAHGLRGEALDRLKQAIRDDIYKSEPHLGSLYDRAVEIEHIFELLDLLLEERGLITRSELMARSAQDLAARWADDPIPAQHYVLAAYTSLASSWQVLLDTWLGEARFSFWLSEAPDLYHASSPLKDLLQKIEAKVPLIRRVAAKNPDRRLLAAAAPACVDEVSWAVQGVEQLIAQGFPPEQLAILVTDETNYAAPLAMELEQRGLQANLALARPWASSLPGRTFRAIEDLWEDRESMRTVLACLDQPLLAQALAQRFGWQPEEAEKQLAHLQEHLLRSGIPASIERMAQHLPEGFSEILITFQDFLSPLHPKQLKHLEQWVQTLEDWATACDLWTAPEERDLLQSCREGFQHFLDTLRLLGDTGHPFDGRTFWQLFRRHLLDTDIRRTGEPLSGLQVLIVTEARYFPFQAVFLLGCQEGSFPKGLPQDELLDNYLKKAMGLPGWEVLESMEDQTFHLLKSRLPYLVLLRSQRKSEEALVRSRFTEALIVREGLVESKLPARPIQTLGVLLEQASCAEEGAIEGSPETFLSPMSASRLEKLIRCPYAFLLDSLDVRGLEPPPPWGDSRREGEWLHGILEALISGQRGRQSLLPVWRPEASHQIAREGLERLSHLTHLLAPPELRESALMGHLLEHSWPRFAAFLATLYGQHPHALAACQREYRIRDKDRPAPIIQVGDRWKELIGRIDAIDPASEFVVITDYKRRSLPSGRETRTGQAPQLAFYALAIEHLEVDWERRGLLLGYWNIYKGEWEAHAVSEQARSSSQTLGLSKRDTPAVHEVKEALTALWAWREGQIEAARRFYADPSHCGLCSFSGICRKDDPRIRSVLLEQKHIERYRSEGSSHES